MALTTRYAAAVQFAANAHDGQVRKGTSIPYISHPIAVSALVLEHGGDEDQAIGGLLHDVVEDCGEAYAERIAADLGDRVARIVDGCTDGIPDALTGRRAPWRERKQAYLGHLSTAADDVLLVSACDKLHNLTCIASDLRGPAGAAVFDRFTAGRDGTIWYYRSLHAIFDKRMRGRIPGDILSLLTQLAA